MMNEQTFSKRKEFDYLLEKEITVREDAPDGLRGFIRMAFYALEKKPSDLRRIITKVLKTPPDSGNWSEFPNIDNEVEFLLDNCKWYAVYDIIEAITQKLVQEEQDIFTREVNEYFIANGIGWKIVNGRIETRGDGVYEISTKKVEDVLETAKLQTAKIEIAEAIRDLSRRPTPDITGAIQHSLACLECVMREFTGDKNSTLGDLMKKFPNSIPSPLNQAVTKIWGFSSEQGRHLKEGKAPEYLEAELIVEVTSAIATYLGKKLRESNSVVETDKFPF